MGVFEEVSSSWVEGEPVWADVGAVGNEMKPYKRTGVEPVPLNQLRRVFSHWGGGDYGIWTGSMLLSQLSR